MTDEQQTAGRPAGQAPRPAAPHHAGPDRRGRAGHRARPGHHPQRGRPARHERARASTTTCAPARSCWPWPRPTAWASSRCPRTTASRGPSGCSSTAASSTTRSSPSPRSSARSWPAPTTPSAWPSTSSASSPCSPPGASPSRRPTSTRRRLTDAVNGAAVAEIGRRATIDDGHPRLDDLRRAVQALGPTTVPLRRRAGQHATTTPTPIRPVRHRPPGGRGHGRRAGRPMRPTPRARAAHLDPTSTVHHRNGALR